MQAVTFRLLLFFVHHVFRENALQDTVLYFFPLLKDAIWASTHILCTSSVCDNLESLLGRGVLRNGHVHISD